MPYCMDAACATLVSPAAETFATLWKYNGVKDEPYDKRLTPNTAPAGGIPKPTLCAALRYYDTFEEMAVRGANHGGYAESVIIHAVFGYRFTPRSKT